MYDRTLLLFSIACVFVFVAWIVVPYVRRRQDLVSARSFFLAGCVLYVGLSGINSATMPHYYNYGGGVYKKYFSGVVVFFLAFYLANTRMKWPARLASRHFRKWPPLEGFGILLPVFVSLMVMGAQIAVRNVPGLAVLSVRTAIIAPVFALTFALYSWFRAKYNPVAIAGVIGAFAIGAYTAFAFGGGRRPLYAMLVTVPCCAYWWYFRYQSPKKVLMLVLACLVFVPVVDAAYRSARWQGVTGRTKMDAESGAKMRWSIFRQALFGGLGDSTVGGSALKIGHNAAENSLVTIYMVTEGRAQFPNFDVRPLHSVYVLSTLLIPRALWDDKPKNLGLTLPFDSRVLGKNVKTNWGPGIVAHGYHDGGLIVLAFYGFVCGCGILYLDELLRNNSNNPYMVAFLAAAAVQITGLVRGDISTFAALGALCFFVMLALAVGTRMLLGVERSSPPLQYAHA